MSKAYVSRYRPRDPLELATMTASTAGAEPLKANQLIILELIYERAWGEGAWPKYGNIRRQLRQAGVNLPVDFEGLVPRYLNGNGWTQIFQDDESIRLTPRGFNETEGGRTTVIPLFLQILEYMVAEERTYEPIGEITQPTVFKSNIADFLTTGARPRHIAEDLATKIGILVLQESTFWRSGSSSGIGGNWSVILSEEISRYEGVKSLEDYLNRTPFYSPPTPAIPVPSADSQLTRRTPFLSRFWKSLVEKSKPTTKRVIEGVAIAVMAGIILTLLINHHP